MAVAVQPGRRLRQAPLWRQHPEEPLARHGGTLRVSVGGGGIPDGRVTVSGGAYPTGV